MKNFALALALALTCTACGGGDPDPPTCGMGEVNASGDPDMGQLGIGFTADSYAFVNALGGSPGTLDASMTGTGATLHLEWATLVADGDSVDVRGNIIDGAGYGNCDAGPFDSTMTVDSDGHGGTFALHHLRMGPPFCGEEISGTIVGCFRSPN